MRTIVQFSFLLITILMLIVGAVSLQYISNTQGSQTSIVKDNIVKLELAHTMRESIRLRQLSLNTILYIDDPFEQDEEINKFYQYAGLYRNALEILHTLPLSNEEEVIHSQLVKHVRIAQPLNRKSISLIYEGKIYKSKNTIKLAQEAQSTLLNTLDDLVNLQKKYANDAVNTGQDNFDKTYFSTIILGAIAVLFTLGTGFVVSRYVANKNIELIGKNKELSRANKAAQAATKSKSEFLSSMSHELRTPMNAVLGYTELVLEDKNSLNEDHKKYLTTVLRSGNHLLELINQVLDLSKIEADAVDLSYSNVKLRELFDSCLSMLKTDADKRNIRFVDETTGNVLEDVWTDKLRIKQILINLLSNAVKYNRPGGTVTLSCFSSNTKSLRIEVKDTGEGLTQKQIGELFQPFHRLVDDPGGLTGIGIGLVISKQLVELLGGTIGAESTLDEGSVFWIELPLSKNGSK